jgi:hypothetical protein
MHTKAAKMYKAKNGKEYKLREGSRAQVYHETAYKTTGGLTKADLVRDEKTGRIMSKKRRALGRKAWANMDPETKKKFKENAEKNRFKAGAKKAPAKKAAPKKRKAPASKKKAAPKKKKAAASKKKK